MNWSAVGAFADILAAFAVFLSLIYLAIQTRDNTKALRSSAFHQVRDSFADISLGLALDPPMVSVLTRAMQGKNDLTELEALQYQMYVTSVVRRGESAFFQSHDGALQMESWLGIKETVLSHLDNTYGRSWWNDSTQNPKIRYTPEYVRILDEGLGDRVSEASVAAS